MNHDGYLPCKAYENQAAHASQAGFSTFYDEKSKEYFFALLDADGQVLLRSEGYPQVVARENGIASVIKNRTNREFFAVKEENGAFFVTLRAANYREIARSCPYNTETAALELIEYIMGTKKKAESALPLTEPNHLAAVAAMTAAATTGAALAANAKTENKEDDYLACRQYDGHGDADENGFVRFLHTNERFYFTWLDDNGKVKMRSEGYPTAAARDNGINSVIRNRDNKERYEIKEMAGKHFVILKAANHQEIARSCPKDNLDAVGAFFPILGLGGAAAVATSFFAGADRAIDVPSSTPSVPTPIVDVEDDYLPCRAYHGHMTAPRDGFRVFISQQTGKYYFAVVDEDDDVALRSEGHLTAKERDADLEDVVKNKFTRERYEIKKVGMNHYFIVLRNATGKEIARSCGYDSLNALYAAAPFLNPAKPDAKVGLGAPLAIALAAAAAAKPKTIAPVAAPTPILPTIVADEPTGNKNWWWWLLLPLLALLAWWLFSKGCGKTETGTIAPPTAPKAEIKAADTVKIAEKTTPTPEVVAPTAPSCGLNWILFGFNKDVINSDAEKELAEMAKILKENKDYVGVISAHTDTIGSDAYNEALSGRRANNTKAALVKLGIDADRLKTETSGKKAPVAKNTTDDNGRQYNRRVELYIRDKAGKDICQSIAPNIPTELKTQ